MAGTAVAASEWVDPRIRRTRQMLRDALEHLLEGKSIEEIAVGDIAERAGLNRATFYDHYQDKFSLLEGLIECRFEEMLRERGLVFDGTCGSAVLGIIQITCEYLAGLPRTECPERRQMEKHLETAVMSVVRGMILGGPRRHETVRRPVAELVAATMSGAIYGGAREWVGMAEREPATVAAKSIFSLVAPMLARMQERTSEPFEDVRVS